MVLLIYFNVLLPTDADKNGIFLPLQNLCCEVVHRLQVIGGRVTVVQGATVTLPCQLTDSKETLKQILWQRSTRGRPLKDNFFNILEKNGKYPIELTDERFRFVGSFTEKNGSLQLSKASLMDEGSYSCIFLLLESGNHKTEVSLHLLGTQYFTWFLIIEILYFSIFFPS
uniref:Ig-like domain-containing protein n=1 Tax=Gouania willdenowi TaxID=441366 RepID=A0A8C5GGS4_GOUWI